MNLRPAVLDDGPQLFDLLSSFVSRAVEPADFDSALRDIVGSPDRVVLVIEEDGRIAGMSVVNILRKLASRVAIIDEVVVDSDFRGRGYGEKLMKACQAWAFENGADSIELTSRPSRQAANALYQKLGYELRETNAYRRKRD